MLTKKERGKKMPISEMRKGSSQLIPVNIHGTVNYDDWASALVLILQYLGCIKDGEK